MVAYDFYGTKRSTTPDIGIYEGPIPATDAGLVYTNLTNQIPCPGDSTAVYVTVKNFGTKTLTSADIMYALPGKIAKKVSWTGKLDKWQEKDSILLGYVSVPNLELFKIKAWTLNPNNTPDEIKFNDTIYISQFPSLKGEYSIADTLADFLSISAAVEELKLRGVCGPVVFNIDSGEYKEQITIPLIAGASEKNTITFQGADKDSSKVIIEFNGSHNFANNFIVKLDGAKYIQLKHLTLYTYVDEVMSNIQLTHGASSNTISNCVLTGIYHNLQSALIEMMEGEHDSNLIINNRFTTGGYQVKISGSEEYPCSANNIIGNIFDGPAYQSIYINYQKDLIINQNIARGVKHSHTAVIELIDCNGKILIERNKFNISAGYGAGFVYLNETSGSADTPIIFANNFLSQYSQYGGSGLALQDVSNIKILHNNFNFLNESPWFLGIWKVSNAHIYNNVYKTKDEEAGVYYGFVLVDTAEIHSDYNVFYTSGDRHFTQNDFYYSLKEWQNQFGKDKHSIFIDPLYMDSVDLHIDNAKALNNTGFHFKEVTFDIDGEPRDTLRPDIGADEYDIDSTKYFDLALFKILNPDTTTCTNPDSLIVEIVNLSTFPITSFDTRYKLYNQVYKVRHWTDTIMSLDTFRANLGYFPFAPNTLYKFQLEVLKPNKRRDNYSLDNTKSVEYYSLEDVRIFKKLISDCDTVVELYIKNFPRESVKWSNGSTADRITISSPGTYSVTVKSGNGCISTDSITIK